MDSFQKGKLFTESVHTPSDDTRLYALGHGSAGERRIKAASPLPRGPMQFPIHLVSG